MDRTVTLLVGAGLGAGLMYFLDPRTGRRRRAVARDQMVHLTHQAQKATNIVAKDIKNRAQGLAAGDLSVLVGGRRAVGNPLRGAWSPSARALMGLLGTGMFLYGLTERAPTACILGTVGLALTAEGITNAGIEDIAHIPQNVAGIANQVKNQAANTLGLGGQTDGQHRRTAQPAGMGV
jgi:hypothetical protein